MNDEERVTYFGETDARNKRLRFGIKKKDRSRHMYVIGKTGMGKSTLLENLAVQDIMNGEGLAFIDPHGKSADLLLEYIPEHRIKDVVYFAPFDLDYPISFNVLEDVGADRRHLVANGLMSAFKKIWVDAWSARMEYILTNILLALLEYPGSTLLGVNRMLVDKDFRNTIVNNISDPSVKAFWTEEYAKYTDKFAAEAAPAIQNKVGQFVANPLVRNIIGQSNSSFDIRKIMDDKKIFIVNLSKGRVGEGNANLLGAMIITKIYLAAMSRADLSEAELKKSSQFYLYVDEFQSFANESFADILSEARKYKLNLTIAHQYVEQMTEEVRAAVFGNVGTMAIFRVGAYDADIFQKEFAPQFSAEDIVNLQQYQMYLKLMIDGVTSTPFSAKGMPPIPRPERMYVQEIIDASREQFAKGRIEIEDEIRRWHIEKIKPVGQSPVGQGPGGRIPLGHSPSDQGSSNYNASRQGSFGQGNSGQSHNEQRNKAEYGHPDSKEPRNMTHKTGFMSSEQGQGREKSRDGGGNTGRREGGDSDRNRRNESPETHKKDQGSMLQRDNRDMAKEKGKNENNFAFRNAIRDAERDRREYGTKPKQEDLDRETELRNAISLNYLKDKKEEEQRDRNKEKEAKPQNVMALKEALLGLLGETSIKSGQQESQTVEVSSVKKNESVHVSEHSNTNQIKHVHTQHVSHTPHASHESIQTQTSESTKNQAQQPSQSSKDIKDKEVDINTLKQIFE
ncbi:MAG: hypothetical protein RIQ72_516 [Candidatus Parcubacteria bacterium]|jgi:hypothetical protein